MGEQPIKISVRELVEFVLRSGDIDAGHIGAGRALEGARVHRHLQSARKRQALLNGETYECEYSLAHQFTHEGLTFKLEGRADGLLFTVGGGVAVEEIKSTARPLSAVQDDPGHWHWAQAICYAYMYWAGRCHVLRAMEARLTYAELEGGGTKTFARTLAFAEAQAFFYGVVERYAAFARQNAEKTALRDETGRRLAFPYECYRAGQREFAAATYRTIARGAKLFAGAPTGTGKTVSVLFPAVKALPEGHADKVFYVTAKTTTQRAAQEALARMETGGLMLRSVTLTAKEKICVLQKPACGPETCERARGHFDRVNAALYDLAAHETAVTRAVAEACAARHRVCPYELTLDAATFADCVICDCNYVYDPKAALGRFFGDEAKGGRYAVLHDEAHNLADRARDMFSAELRGPDVSAARKAGKETRQSVYRALGRLKNWFGALPKEEGVEITAEPPETLLELVRRFAGEAEKWFAENEGNPGGGADERLLEFYFKARDFLRISELFDERYVFYRERFGGGDKTAVKLLCLDPSHLLASVQKKLKASVFFSATLSPARYFRDVLGGAREDYDLRLPSPFPPENLCLLVDGTVSTLYRDRDSSLLPVALRLHSMVSAKKGNYMVFFSSYEYMERVRGTFTERFPEVAVAAQARDMTEEEREAFLSRFSAGGGALLGFVVLGGVFSEGVDLAGERLIGAAVVGVGLPKLTPERGVMADYYQAQGLGGFDYAYVFPGVNKVLQAAGRVIRSAGDRGVILLIDARYATRAYKELFPPEWAGCVSVSGEGDITRALQAFWGKEEGEHGPEKNGDGVPRL